ncbi:NADP-specific glutamate dehydrogenase [Fodinibius sediminis]|uniref:Glutamate dehydrogenase n=1 Tax=Fodinibius sediminis TaxID=1214077 RepID=A0A521BL02_9BACT|nr:NADP-specific glutamate dehydrogenase [Fodinibius sediminis]SMO47766.1 glutamate dehydrogenase (NAD(P)+)/glutamate dehydrogenase (NADP+) [Fodinibius sediminis]
MENHNNDANHSINSFLNGLKARNPGQSEFQEAVQEVLESVWDMLEERPRYYQANILDRITEPERVIMFRVPWMDDEGKVHVNRGYRVEFNSAIGPYKGGLRFHPSVNLDILKFLAFEQIFKNSLTTMPMGGAKGGANFDVKGKSDMEIMRFCQSFMTELYRHIGHNTDVPAGDIGVGKREIGYLFGQYKRLQNEYTGVLTGKAVEWGGSKLRTEATGYGLVYFVRRMFESLNESLEGKTITVSGSGNVAQFATEKAIQLGARVVTLSDSNGVVYDPDGIDEEKLQFVKQLKNVKRGRIREYAEKYDVEYIENGRPWHIECDIALPCATQNEIDADDAAALIENGCKCVAEGANKPAQREAAKIFMDSEILFAPGKAANAGGVAVSGLEMTQNEMRIQWLRSEVDEKLQDIMNEIHDTCVTYGDTGNSYVNYVQGANIAGFIKVADAMLDQGVV